MLRVRLEEEGESGDGLTGDAIAAWELGRFAPSATALLAAADIADVELEILFNQAPVVERLRRLERQLRSHAVQIKVLKQRLRGS